MRQRETSSMATMSSESKEELNGEAVIEQEHDDDIKLTSTELIVPVVKDTSKSLLSTETDEAITVNGTEHGNESCVTNDSVEQSNQEQKSNLKSVTLYENAGNISNDENEKGNQETLNENNTDTDTQKTICDEENGKINLVPLSQDSERNIVINVPSENVQEVKKLQPNVDNQGNLVKNKENDLTSFSALSNAEDNSCTVTEDNSCTVTDSVASQDDQTKIINLSDKVLVSNSENLISNPSEPAKLDKIDPEINEQSEIECKLNSTENAKEIELECPHLEPEVPMELDISAPLKDCNKNVKDTKNSEIKNKNEIEDKTNSKETVSPDGSGANKDVHVPVNGIQTKTSVESKCTGIGKEVDMEGKIVQMNHTASEKVIVYPEDTVRIVASSEINKSACDKENTSKLNELEEECRNIQTKDGSCISSEKSVLETPKSPETISNKPKGQKLDELLSKIATKASNDLNIPKKAKARKTFSQATPAVEKAIVSSIAKPAPSIANLTFNVKMLEKQGVLDIPKVQNKRKAFEPFKVKQSDSVEHSPSKVAAKSPVKSPKKDSPFFNTSKVIKGRRRKKKKMGSYKLPSEKKQKPVKDRKKASEERQLSSDEKNDLNYEIKMEVSHDRDIAFDKFNTNNSANSSCTKEQNRVSPLSQTSVKSADSEIKTDLKQQTILDNMIKNSKLFTNSTEKAKKTVRSGIEHGSQGRNLEAFLKRVTHSAALTTQANTVSPSTEAVVGTLNQESLDLLNSCLRKRKAEETTQSARTPPPMKPTETQEEKKRKTEIPVGKSPPPPMMILTGSPPLSVGGRPIVPAPVSIATTPSVTFAQLTSPNSKQPPKAIIQNGTLNGMPVFQIISNGNITGQLVAIGNQGQSILPGSLPKTAILQSPPRLPGAPAGLPVIFTPVGVPTVVSSGIVTQTQNQISLLAQNSGGVISLPNKPVVSPVISVSQSVQMKSVVQPIAAPIPLSVFNQSIVTPTQTSSILGVSGQVPILSQFSRGPLEQNLLKPSHIPNGLYPVTPPKTPDDQAGSDSGSQESAEMSPSQQISPEKDIIPLCTCKLSGASFPKLVTSVTFCQALDSVDNKAMGCCNKVTNPQLVRPAVKIPFMAVCEHHRKRLKLHQCCPGCGHFCTQGKFLQCRNEGNQIVHNFHEQCQVIKDGKNYCPHCGEASAQVEVTLMLQEKKPQAMECKSSRIQIKAKMAVADKKSGCSEDESSDETTVVLEKTKKVLSTGDIPIGPDKHSLERVLSCLSQERPKKYRHLPKCLFTPAYDNDLERVVYMLEDGHDPNEKYDDLEGQGAIHAAAAVGSLPIVHVLIQAGASPHLQDKNLRTPLMFAAENNHHHVVKYLLKVGSVIDSKADDGMTSLHYAAKAGHVSIIKILLDVEGLDIDVKDDGGYTPLIWAAEHEQLDVVKYLLKRNADPNLRDSEENTALHWAAFSGSANVAEVLLNTGCELDSLNMHGDRPLHIASRQDHYECVVLFLARGADVELENNKGETPLKCCIDETSPTYLALKVNRQLKSFGAKHMGRPEKLLTRDISKGRENIPIPCVNAVDDEGIPTDYLYVTDNVETKCLNVNRVIGSLQSCQCKDDCSSIYCACGKSSVKCWYDKYGRLSPEFNMLEPSLIFECNRACECWTTCNNRVVQNGVMSRLQVFKTVGRGWGCKTLIPIPRGTFICEYIGEHISDHEADRREDDSYLFDLDNKDGETYCIDARKYGNIARFINHLCEPNLVPVKVFVDSQDLRFPRICLFASRDIMADEELGFDYGEKFWIIKWKHFTCTCGSLKCRYSNETIHKTIEEYRLRHEEEVGASHE